MGSSVREVGSSVMEEVLSLVMKEVIGRRTQVIWGMLEKIWSAVLVVSVNLGVLVLVQEG